MPTVTVVDGIVLVHGRRVLPALVDSDSDLSESGSTSSQATEASHWGSSQTAEVSNCGRSSPKTAGDSDSIIDGHITGSHEVDNEASFSHRYESEIEDESCFEAAAYDDLYCSSP